ncbi:MAG: T9SS type A sorting domain-containing protein [Balneola sp.]
MRKLLLLLLVFPICLSAQEKYFHELKGMEDSTGTTHLFYRMYKFEEYQLNCGDSKENHYSEDQDVYHFETNNKIDTILFNSPGGSGGCYNLCGDQKIYSYDFYNNNYNNWIIEKGSGDCGERELLDYSGRSALIYSACIIKVNPLFETLFLGKSAFTLSNKNDSIYYNSALLNQSFKISINDTFFSPKSIYYGENEEDFNQLIDSIGIDYKVERIHPNIDSIFYSRNYAGQLMISEHHSTDFQLVNEPGYFKTLAFDEDSSILYSIVQVSKNDTNRLLLKKSDDFGRTDSWKELNLPDELTQLQYLVTDSKQTGNIFIADSSTVFKSSNFGSSFELIAEMDYRITGLYKKPNSDILYVLTTDELFEVNTETKAVTSLKKLPVSNEELKETPSSIKLHQNYPNPFNPTTTISFELDKPENVTLTIFDALGRTIAVLVDEQRTTGVHEMSFDASTLSSGIYFYRLEVGAFSETKKFSLIK